MIIAILHGNFAKFLDGSDTHIINSSQFLNNKILETYKSEITNSSNFKLISGNCFCSEVFDYYIDNYDNFKKLIPKDLNIIGCEMEAFALFYTAKFFHKNASCLLSVVDSRFKKEEISTKDRETSLNNMIQLALDAAIKLD